MIALVMGRGVEGCGVTRYTIEYKNWLEKQWEGLQRKRLLI
jgi:hypothetical protein